MPSKNSTIRSRWSRRSRSRPFLPIDDQLDLLAGGQQLLDAPARAAHDRAVEAAAQAAVGGGDDQQVHLVLAGAGQQRRRAGQARHAGGEVLQHRRHALGERPRRLGLLLRAPQLGGRDELHGAGDLARLAHGVHPCAHVLEAGHRTGALRRSARGTCRAVPFSFFSVSPSSCAAGLDRVQDVLAARAQLVRACPARTGRRPPP